MRIRYRGANGVIEAVVEAVVITYQVILKDGKRMLVDERSVVETIEED